MTKRESQIANLISSRIKKQDPGAEVILFGSHARGQSNEESDWEIGLLNYFRMQNFWEKTRDGDHV